MKLTTLITAILMCTSVSTFAAKQQASVQIRYEYDVQGRVTTRTAYAWNGEEWQPALKWAYTYTATGYTIELSRYDRRHQCFDAPISKTVCTFTPDASQANVSTYTRRNPETAYQLADSMKSLYPHSATPLFSSAHDLTSVSRLTEK